MDYLLAAYVLTVVVLGLAAWRLRAGLRRAEADLTELADLPAGAHRGTDAGRDPDATA